MSRVLATENAGRLGHGVAAVDGRLTADRAGAFAGLAGNRSEGEQ